ncbi:accessory gland protein Acp63F-like [Drosophila serrata]|uniref:accessory gland protein Acp63F-like n=1 Tax=Drosophila serrata TaxID=7274 RepID=UPI000A1D16B7|nr:accessory gland protein Acp63F-like [Drosophila serrata]
MKIFVLLFLLGLCRIMIVSGECNKNIRRYYHPVCGILEYCYQSANNADILELYSCRRKEEGLQDFQERREGRCPSDKPQCPPISTDI